MIRLLFILSFVTIFSLGSAQDFPVFKNSKDSVLFSQAGNRLWNRLPGDTTNLARLNFDSISRVIERLRQKAIGWSQVYKPRSSFVPYADLKSGKVNPDNITRLSISNIQSRQLPKEVLLCKNLEELELVNTRINEIQAEVNTLTKLTSIYLYNNVPSGRLILGKNDHVSYLRIAGHHPDKLPRSYKNFSLLDSLNINRTMATRLPNVKKNKELKIIYAMRNNITLRSSKKNTSLEYLDLRMNKISVIPNSIGRKYPALKTLSFNTNPIKKVKPGLGKLKNLEYLSFYTTGLTKIPKSVYQLSKLKVIDLFDNNIETIDPEIKNLQKLEVLYLANNKIYGLPDEIGELKSLESLYIYNNRMDTLPASLQNLNNLKVLWINDNFFHTMPPAAWQLKSLSDLDASQNLMKYVPHEMADTKLAILVLSGSLLSKEKENPALFEKLRLKGTRIIYYNADGFNTD